MLSAMRWARLERLHHLRAGVEKDAILSEAKNFSHASVTTQAVIQTHCANPLFANRTAGDCFFADRSQLLEIPPVVTNANVDDQRDFQLDHRLHLALHQRAYFIHFCGRNIE